MHLFWGEGWNLEAGWAVEQWPFSQYTRPRGLADGRSEALNLAHFRGWEGGSREAMGEERKTGEGLVSGWLF